MEYLTGCTAMVLGNVEVTCNGAKTFFAAGELVRIKFVYDDGRFFCVSKTDDYSRSGDTVVFGPLYGDQIAVSEGGDDNLIAFMPADSMVH
ncbi:hypothetical protein HJB78_00985 [Rhizobium lentis]|uniref:hypothetical protein n=1 Tax=Rhizobium lentis TaxID=1138194 RepID=UPI001C83B6F2|nr:hypothetical protein [Rhizobium lentis]MBX5149580.1 hypothetical protein [Rhizobium lentis]